MKNCILICTFFQAVYSVAADETFNYDHKEDEFLSILLKKIRDLEERDREFDKKFKETEVLKERLAEAERRLTNMQELEYRLSKAEEKIRMLVNRVENKNVKKSTTLKVVDSNGTHDILPTNSSSPFWIRRAVFSIDSRLNEMDDKIHELVSFKNRIQTALKVTEINNRKRTITRKAAFSAMFSSAPVLVTPGRALQFDRVNYNEGNAYDTTTGIFTCPVSGTYFFFTNILSMYQSGAIETEIVIEGQGKGKTRAFGVSDYDQGSTAASLHCDMGQRVWVRAMFGSQAYGSSFSTFTGVILWQDDAATNSN